MQHETRALIVEGLRLRRLRWLPDGEVSGVLAVIHGYGEHGGRYAHVAAALEPAGFAVEACDLRGHGRSEGARGHVERFDGYLRDSRRFLEDVAEDHPGAPLFVLGHSLGGLIVALLAEGPPDAGGRATGGADPSSWAGIVLSSPFLRLGEMPSASVLAGARVLAAITPARDIGNTLDPEALSHDAGVVAAYRADPLNHHVATARWAVETLTAQKYALAGATRLSLPLLVLYGSADAIASPVRTRALYERASSPDKTLRCYEGWYHELFNEVGKERALADLAAWLRRRRRPAG